MRARAESKLTGFGAIVFGAEVDTYDLEGPGRGFRRRTILAPTCTSSAPSLLAPTKGARFGNSFEKGPDVDLVLSLGQIWQKIHDCSSMLVVVFFFVILEQKRAKNCCTSTRSKKLAISEV